MEPTGLAISAFSLPLHLIQQTEGIINAFLLSKDPPFEVVQLVHELKALRDILRIVPDLIERQATDDADVETLSLLARNSRELQESLEDLESLSRNLNRPFLRRFWSSRLSNVRACNRAINRIQEGRSNLKALLRSSESAPAIATDHLDLTKSKTPDPKLARVIGNWLDELPFPVVLENLAAQYESGTGAWLLHSPTFLEWEANLGKTLWCSGLPGAGKSVLCSMVIKYLRDKFPSATVPVLLAFFNFHEGSTQTPANVVRSLLAQLIRQSGRVSDMLMSLYERHAHSSHIPLEDLWSTLYSDIASFDRVFIICDALDEYVNGSEGFVNDFQSLFKLSMTSLFVTSRPTLFNKAILGNFAQLEILARDSELREYIQTRLSESRFNNRPELCNEIVQTIVHQSNGVFLNARLLLESVLSKHTIMAVRRSLSTNQTLNTLYDARVERLMYDQTDQSHFALEALLWLAYALRPLTIGELLEAIGIQIGSEDLNPDDLPFIDTLNQICAGLIFIDRARHQVFLVHYTLNEYLQLYLPKFQHLLPNSEEPQTVIAKKCLTCLRFKSFSLIVPSEQADLGDRLNRYAMLGYAARYWGEHAHHVSLEHIIDDVMALFDSSANTMSAGLVMSIYEQHPGHYEKAYRGMIGLHISAYFGLTEIVEYMMEDKKLDPNVATVGGWTALHWATRRGWTSTVSSLLRRGASTSAATKLDGWNALHLATKEGHLDIVKSLIGSNVDINATDVLQRTALYLATWAGHVEVVRCLLENSADPKLRNAYGATALHCAAKKGHELIVRHLLDRGADVNAVDTMGLKPLDEANKRKNDAVIKLLIEKGAESKRSNNMQLSDNVIDDLDWETYTVNEEATRWIQKGSQCVCHVLEKAMNVDTSEPSLKVFRKTYSLSDDADGYVRKYFESERIILERLRHPNVVTYLDFDEDPEQNAFFLYTEYCDLGNLNTCHGRPPDTGNEEDEDGVYGFYTGDPSPIGKSTTPLDGQSVWTLVAQLASALAYLHYGLAMKYKAGNWSASFERSWTNIIHRDIKPANVVQQSSESSVCTFKLCDLGIASEAGKGAGYNTTRLIGTPGYRPPEILRNRPWATKGDIWALGETIRDTNKLKDTTFESATKLLIDRCTAKLTKSRPSSLDIMEEANDILQENNVLATLAPSARLQIQATHAILGGEGGYILKAFNLVAELLDEIVPFEDKDSKEHRRVTLERLDNLWKDGADTPFLRYPNEFSLHILVLLRLSHADRTKHLDKIILSEPNVNNQWRRSRWTPLHLAAQAGNQDVVEWLLAHGGNKNGQDLHGRTPASYANRAEYPAIFSLLQPIMAGHDLREGV